MEQTILTIPQQVEIALDGRTQRWLALQIRMPETDLSKKMNGKVEFTEEEIKQINTILKSKIQA
jgi:hypothetical protein